MHSRHGAVLYRKERWTMVDAWSISNNNQPPETGTYATKIILQIGQRIIYNGEEGQIIRISPLVVVKTRNRIICGALFKKIMEEEHASSCE